MVPQIKLAILVMLWVVLVGIVLIRGWNREGSSGLTMFYVINLSLIHFFGAFVYVFPWYEHGDMDTTLKGFRIATYGIIAFFIGNVILRRFFFRFFKIRLTSYGMTQLLHYPTNLPKTLLNLPKIYFLTGLISYFTMHTFFGRLPTLNALVSVGQQMMIVGICLACWKAMIEKDKKSLLCWLLITLSFPFITIINQGFLGYGAIMTMIILLFGARFFRPKWKVLAVGFLFTYLGLTFYEGYMRDRGELRELVWGGAPVTERVEELWGTVTNPEWFNPFDVEHLKRIDKRLNQNFLVGKAADYLKIRDYARGETLWDALIALIPRIMWQDKPVYAGSGDIVSRYTGLSFAEGTSVGVGQVMEFYINFGVPCVVIGFLILGIVISIIDAMAGYHLLKGDWQKFALWILPGLAFLQVGGSLVEVTGSAGSGVIVAYMASKLRSHHYPVMIALIYLGFVVYVAKPYLELIVAIAIIVILAKKYIIPTLRKVKKTVSH